jgi:hypothetical protein
MMRLFESIVEENHRAMAQCFNLECGDTSPLSHDTTYRVVSKRGHIRAVQIQALPRNASAGIANGSSVG